MLLCRLKRVVSIALVRGKRKNTAACEQVFREQSDHSSQFAVVKYVVFTIFWFLMGLGWANNVLLFHPHRRIILRSYLRHVAHVSLQLLHLRHAL